MRKWYSFLEIVHTPLKVCFLGCALIALSGLVLNPNVSLFFSTNNTIVIAIAEICKYLGGVLVNFFPVMLLLAFLGKRDHGNIIMFIGFISYLAFNVMTMFFAKSDLVSTAYSSILGLSVNGSNFQSLSAGTHTPLQTGLVGVVTVALLTRHSYFVSRSKSPYTLLFPYIDKDTWALILSIIYCSLAGIVFAYIWPTVINSLFGLFNFIATDITNPMNMFVYGLLERLLCDVGMGNLIRYAFWFTEMGGTWIQSLTSVSVSGDVSIWTAQSYTAGYSLGPGRFISAYYVLNLFAIPGMLLALSLSCSDTMERRRFNRFFLWAIAISLLGNTIYPFEIAMLIISPLLYFFHICFSAILFGVFQAAEIYIGYAYSGQLVYATPGNIFDLLYYSRSAVSSRTIQVILIVGVFSFLLYFLISKFYFKKCAVGLFDSSNLKNHTDLFIESVGGLNNIKSLHSSPIKLTVQVGNNALLNYNAMQKLRPSKVVESHAGYSFYIGAQSLMIKNEVNKRKKASKRPD